MAKDLDFFFFFPPLFKPSRERKLSFAVIPFSVQNVMVPDRRENEGQSGRGAFGI